MTYISFIFLLLLTYRITKKLGIRSIIYPGLWFSLAWSTSIICYWAIDAVGGVPIHDSFLLNQLMTYVLITSLAFFLLTFFGTRAPQESVAQTTLLYSNEARTTYALFCSISLLGSLTNWIYLGARLSYSDDIRMQWLESIPPITARMWYLFVLSIPASIYAGRFFMVDILNEKSFFRIKTLFWLMPLISGVFWSLGTGGRQTSGLILFFFAIGSASALASTAIVRQKIPSRLIVKFFTISLFSAILFGLFVGTTGLSRAKQQGAAASSFDDIWYLAPIGQFISYNGLSLATHQAYGDPRPRDISETGPVSLGGLQNFGLKYITGWRPLTVDDTNPERALASKGLPLASGTRNIFYDFQADFGPSGAIITSIIIAVISHILFVRPKSLTGENITASTPHIMMILFWGYSHQFSLLMFDTFYWLVASSAIWDLTMALYRQRRPSDNHTAHQII